MDKWKYKPNNETFSFEVDFLRGEEVPEGWTNIQPPQPCFAPFFDFDTNEWIEKETGEEKQKRENEKKGK